MHYCRHVLLHKLRHYPYILLVQQKKNATGLVWTGGDADNWSGALPVRTARVVELRVQKMQNAIAITHDDTGRLLYPMRWPI
jgi:chloramphenicol 3-O-phosphotransferase